MVMEIWKHRRGRSEMSPGESMTYDARIRYWEEEWLSQLLEEALRLKGKAHGVETECACKA